MKNYGFLTCVVVAVVAAVLWAAPTKLTPCIKTSRLELVGPNGKVQAVLSAGKKGPWLVVYNPQGKTVGAVLLAGKALDRLRVAGFPQPKVAQAKPVRAKGAVVLLRDPLERIADQLEVDAENRNRAEAMRRLDDMTKDPHFNR